MSKRGRTTGLEARTTVVDSSSLECIVDNEQTKHLAIGQAVPSDAVSAGGHIWRINCYPRGSVGADNGEYLSLYLGLRGKSRNVRAIFEFLLMDKHGKPSSLAARSQVHVFGGQDNRTSLGWTKFVKRVDLEANYVAEIISAKLLDGMDGTDVSFTTNGETFHAHRAVLAARSPIFRAKFFGSKAEATSSNISLDDIEPATFKVLLNFMYTDALPGDDGLGHSPPIEMFQHLLAAADKYALHRLKLICAQKLWGDVSLDSIATTLAFAEMYSCLELKTKCIDFLMSEKNFKKVVLTEGFVQLGQKYPSLIAEMRERVRA